MYTVYVMFYVFNLRESCPYANSESDLILTLNYLRMWTPWTILYTHLIPKEEHAESQYMIRAVRKLSVPVYKLPSRSFPIFTT
jgi:hypothetical protein